MIRMSKWLQKKLCLCDVLVTPWMCMISLTALKGAFAARDLQPTSGWPARLSWHHMLKSIVFSSIVLVSAQNSMLHRNCEVETIISTFFLETQGESWAAVFREGSCAWRHKLFSCYSHHCRLSQAIACNASQFRTICHYLIVHTNIWHALSPILWIGAHGPIPASPRPAAARFTFFVAAAPRRGASGGRPRAVRTVEVVAWFWSASFVQDTTGTCRWDSVEVRYCGCAVFKYWWWRSSICRDYNSRCCARSICGDSISRCCTRCVRCDAVAAANAAADATIAVIATNSANCFGRLTNDAFIGSLKPSNITETFCKICIAVIEYIVFARTTSAMVIGMSEMPHPSFACIAFWLLPSFTHTLFLLFSQETMEASWVLFI